MSQLSRWTLWFLIATSYASLSAAVFHWLTDTWSGAASMAMLFTLLVGIPSMVGSVGYLWRKKLVHGEAKIQVRLALLHPVLLLVLWGAAVHLGRFK